MGDDKKAETDAAAGPEEVGYLTELVKSLEEPGGTPSLASLAGYWARDPLAWSTALAVATLGLALAWRAALARSELLAYVVVLGTAGTWLAWTLARVRIQLAASPADLAEARVWAGPMRVLAAGLLCVMLGGGLILGYFAIGILIHVPAALLGWAFTDFVQGVAIPILGLATLAASGMVIAALPRVVEATVLDGLPMVEALLEGPKSLFPKDEDWPTGAEPYLPHRTLLVRLAILAAAGAAFSAFATSMLGLRMLSTVTGILLLAAAPCLQGALTAWAVQVLVGRARRGDGLLPDWVRLPLAKDPG